jgi:hypothetical protein
MNRVILRTVCAVLDIKNEFALEADLFRCKFNPTFAADEAIAFVVT